MVKLFLPLLGQEKKNQLTKSFDDDDKTPLEKLLEIIT
jgi:hypothetical protein